MRKIISSRDLLLTCLTLLMAVTSLTTKAATPLLLEEQLGRQPVEPHVDYWIAGDDQTLDAVAALEDREWQALPGGSAAFGFDQRTYWYRFRLENPSNVPVRRLFEVAYPIMDHLDLYLLTGDQQASWTTGDTLPFDQRPIPHRNFVFPLEVAPQGTATVYLRAQTNGSHQMPLTLWQEQAFHLASERDLAFRAAYFGMLLVMMVFNLFLFLSLRDRTFLYYVLFMGGTLGVLSGLGGLAFQYLLPSYPAANDWLIVLSIPASEFLICLFVIRFLDLSLRKDHWYRLFQSLTVLTALAMLLPFFASYAISVRVFVLLGLLVALSSLLAGLSLWRVGFKGARFFTIAWIVLIFGILATGLNKLGLLPNNFITANGIPIGSALEAVLLSFALGDRFNRQRHALFLEQQKALQALQQQQAMEDKVLHAASHHPLSGLPNRILFEQKINQRLQGARPDEANLALVLLHLRSFDDVNKTLGHQNADDLIRLIAQRVNQLAAELPDILEVERETCSSVAHIEGVTFACALKAVRSDEAFLQIERLVRNMQAPVEFLGLSVDLGLVVGCAFAPANGKDVQTLLRHAFIAFDQADQEASGLAVYQQEMNPYSPRRLTLMTELRRALEQDELALYFQPQVHLASRRIIGFEALLRWQHAERGFVPPDEFIPMAEKTGLINPLTHWVIARALAFCKQLEAVGSEATVAVNISAVNLREPGFCEQVAALLKDAGVLAPRLSLEVTETAAMLDPQHALNVLRALHATGVRLSIDDFGTGQSSLSYIRKLPVHEIKIDRSFVMEMHKNRDDATIVRTTVNMCHDLGYELVAEGVENEEIITLLRHIGCDMAQGYHIARPMDAASALAWLKQTDWIVVRHAG